MFGLTQFDLDNLQNSSV